MRDFCPRRVRASGGISQRSTLPADRVFARDIKSTSPYREVPLVGNEGTLMYDAIIDNERIVFLVREVNVIQTLSSPC